MLESAALQNWVLAVCLVCCAVPGVAADEGVHAVTEALLPVWWINGERPAPRSLEERMAHYGTPAISIAVITSGELAWARAWGSADRNGGRPVTTRTRFQAASISKPITALAALLLMESGQLDIDRPVQDYLRRWTLPATELTEGSPVTVRRILNHTAGLSVPGFPGYDPAGPVPTVLDVLSGRGNTEAVRVGYAPGSAWQYSGGGYTVLQVLLEDVTGEPFAVLLDRLVLTPLEMRRSTFAQPPPAWFHAKAAVGYRADGERVAGGAHIYPEQAAAGLWTTPSELARYLLAVRISARGEAGLLDRNTVGAMLKIGRNNHGLGPDVRKQVDGLRFGHDGGNAGFQSTMFLSLEQGYGAVIMTNSDTGFSLIGEMLQALARHYRWPGFEPEIKQPIRLGQAALARYVGTYQLGERGRLFVEAGQGGLTVTADFHDNTGTYLPESEHTFFDRQDRGSLSFEVRKGKAVALIAGGEFRAVRMDNDRARGADGS
ncbi:MAG: serine hydrolase domain-containing protein [Pseudomonadota bacterium]